MKQNKYIIVNKRPAGLGFKAGRVEFHRDLASYDELAGRDVAGGGMFRVDKEGKNVVLYGKSDDFGVPDDMDFKVASLYGEILEKVSLVCGGDDLSDYAIQYVDKSGETHAVERPDDGMPPVVVYGTPESGSTLEIIPDSALDPIYRHSPRVSKHAGGRFVKKDAAKKKKAKRRAQGRARRR